jgi:hypothetical protein
MVGCDLQQKLSRVQVQVEVQDQVAFEFPDLWEPHPRRTGLLAFCADLI